MAAVVSEGVVWVIRGRLWVRTASSSTSIWTAFCSCLFESAGQKTIAFERSSICASAAKTREVVKRMRAMKVFMGVTVLFGHGFGGGLLEGFAHARIIRVAEIGALDHEDVDEILLRIDPGLRSIGAAVAEG